MRRVPVDQLPDAGSATALDGPTTHRLTHVLRLGVGARVVLFDGQGREVDAELTGAPAGLRATPVSAVRQARPDHELHLLFGVPKGAALDNLLRMAVECGATHLHPLVTRRTVPKGDHPERWGRITAAASAQCGRADVPHLSPLRTLREALDVLPPGLERWVGVPGAAPASSPSGAGAFCVGPEGGLTADELAALLDHGFQPVGLGRWVLRVDTAVVVGLARWSGVGRELA